MHLNVPQPNGLLPASGCGASPRDRGRTVDGRAALDFEGVFWTARPATSWCSKLTGTAHRDGDAADRDGPGHVRVTDQGLNLPSLGIIWTIRYDGRNPE